MSTAECVPPFLRRNHTVTLKDEMHIPQATSRVGRMISGISLSLCLLLDTVKPVSTILFRSAIAFTLHSVRRCGGMKQVQCARDIMCVRII